MAFRELNTIRAEGPWQILSGVGFQEKTLGQKYISSPVSVCVISDEIYE